MPSKEEINAAKERYAVGGKRCRICGGIHKEDGTVCHLCKIDGHDGRKHGTRGTYIQGCRCNKCRRANADYQARVDMRKLQRSYGVNVRGDLVEAAPVREHVELLIKNGWSRRAICRESGVSRSSLHNLLNYHWRTGDPIESMKATTADKIMRLNMPYQTWKLLKAIKAKKAEEARLKKLLNAPYYVSQRREIADHDERLAMESLSR